MPLYPKPNPETNPSNTIESCRHGRYFLCIPYSGSVAPRNFYSCASMDWDDVGLSIGANSAPWPLWARLRPGINLDIPWEWLCEVLDSCESENLAKKPFFLGGCCLCCSSFNPTSSKDSSGVGGSLSKDLSRIDDLGTRENRTESRLCRVTSPTITGDLADMSLNCVQFCRSCELHR